ncbi:MAG: DeoR family transcriptional regulator, partial [Patescibacteria group bacterium]|nr:DeoR family transcriptional regulator [Patescibacteria group bacterium]
MVLGNRKAQLLEYLTREYIQTAEPVGSGVLVDKYDLGVSSATIRNDLAELEKEGFIFQPHTSAGRVPTEKGFLYFVDNFIKPVETRHASSLQESS